MFIAGADAAVLDSLSLFLRVSGLSTVPCRDASELLGALAHQPATPGRACIVLDHHRPGGLDALSTLARMAAARVILPVIVAVGTSDARLVAGLHRLGVAAVLEKPLLQDPLHAAVQQLLWNDASNDVAAPLGAARC